jgi:hypothetical protein
MLDGTTQTAGRGTWDRKRFAPVYAPLRDAARYHTPPAADHRGAGRELQTHANPCMSPHARACHSLQGPGCRTCSCGVESAAASCLGLTTLMRHARTHARYTHTPHIPHEHNSTHRTPVVVRSRYSEPPPPHTVEGSLKVTSGELYPRTF